MLTLLSLFTKNAGFSFLERAFQMRITRYCSAKSESRAKSHIPARISIPERPAVVASRKRRGDWEGQYGNFPEEPIGAAIGRESKSALYIPKPASMPGSQRHAQDHEPGHVKITNPVPKNNHL